MTIAPSLLSTLQEEPLLAAADLSPADLAVRQGRITSTLIAKIAGLYDDEESPSPAGHRRYEAYLELIGEGAPRVMSKPMRWGLELQRAVGNARLRDLREAEPEKDWCLLKVPTLKHPVHEWAASSFDYLLMSRKTGEVRVLEIKTGSQWQIAKYGEEGTDQIPTRHLVQCTWEMEVLRAHGVPVEIAELGSLLGGQTDAVHIVKWDEEFAQGLLDVGAAFMRDHVRPRIEPEADGTEACSKRLKARLVEIAAEDAAVSTPNMDALAAVLEECREIKKGTELREKLALSQMLQALDNAGTRKVRGEWGSFSVFRLNGGPVSFVREPSVSHNFTPKKKGSK